MMTSSFRAPKMTVPRSCAIIQWVISPWAGSLSNWMGFVATASSRRPSWCGGEVEHPVAGRVALHVRLPHDTHALVHRFAVPRRVGDLFQGVEIGDEVAAADGRFLHVDEHFAGSGRRVGHFDDLHLSRSDEPHTAHGETPPQGWICGPAQPRGCVAPVPRENVDTVPGKVQQVSRGR